MMTQQRPRARFRACFHTIEWSNDGAKAPRRHDFMGCDGRRLSPPRAERGDIVSGDWRHTMYYGKYMPLPFVMIRHRTALPRRGTASAPHLGQYAADWLGSGPVSLPSSTDDRHRPGLRPASRHAAGLRGRPRAVTVPTPSYGPSSSAFSSLRGPRRRSRGNACGPARSDGKRGCRPVLGDPSDRDGGRPSFPFLRPLVAHDIVWYLDVFGDDLPLGEQRDLARRAAALAPDFMGDRTPGSPCRPPSSATARRRPPPRRPPLASAERCNGSPDAPFEAFATQVVVACFDLVPRPGSPGTAPAPPPALGSGPATDRDHLRPALAPWDGASLERMELNELNRDAVVGLLRDLGQHGRMASPRPMTPPSWHSNVAVSPGRALWSRWVAFASPPWARTMATSSSRHWCATSSARWSICPRRSGPPCTPCTWTDRLRCGVAPIARQRVRPVCVGSRAGSSSMPRLRGG